MITLPVIVYMALSAYLIYLAVTAAVSKSEDLMVQKIRRFVTIFISAAVLLFILAAAGSLWHIGLMPRECAVMGMSILASAITFAAAMGFNSATGGGMSRAFYKNAAYIALVIGTGFVLILLMLSAVMAVSIMNANSQDGAETGITSEIAGPI